MLNRVVLIGRLVRDPEMRYTPSGVASVRMSIAVQRPFANQQGERETDFIDLRAWRKLAETCAAHLKKGRLIAVEGRLEVRSYDGQDGQRRRVYEVVADDVRFLDRANNQAAAGSTGEPDGDPYGEDPPDYDGPDDEPVPF
jgi:single-strand DNA-binding protein